LENLANELKAVIPRDTLFLVIGPKNITPETRLTPPRKPDSRTPRRASKSVETPKNIVFLDTVERVRRRPLHSGSPPDEKHGCDERKN
jgi:hypothetical protein